MIDVAVFNAHPRVRVRRAALAEAIRCVARGERRRRAAVSVVLIGNRASARMNRRYLGHAGGTDVISFPLGEGDLIEGEIYVNLDKAREQARQYRVTLAEEVSRLVVHGTLHLFGYDDRTAPLARRMKRREDLYVGVLSSGRTSRWT
ncbi:MAG TPA: rRNA maturation RNase YbeY [Bacteroidota bacterium]|nr:rRNA maturation RNase YbeY [Bacteroidota bacterium]